MLDFLYNLFSGYKRLEIFLFLLDIVVVYYIFYRLFLLIKGTKALPMIISIIAIILLYFLSQEEYFNLPTLNWILEKFVSSFIIIIIILFQDDLRRVLSQVGKNPIFYTYQSGKGIEFYEEIIKGVTLLTQKRLGALIVIEREANLSLWAERGIAVNGEVTKELLFSLFNPAYENPMHDGAVIIRKGKISHAGCFLPLTTNPAVDKSLGTRHRAAIGLSEETDAIIIIVSEETGIVSIAHMGKLIRNLDANSMREEIQKLLSPTRMVKRFQF